MFRCAAVAESAVMRPDAYFFCYRHSFTIGPLSVGSRDGDTIVAGGSNGRDIAVTYMRKCTHGWGSGLHLNRTLLPPRLSTSLIQECRGTFFTTRQHLFSFDVRGLYSASSSSFRFILLEIILFAIYKKKSERNEGNII